MRAGRSVATEPTELARSDYCGIVVKLLKDGILGLLRFGLLVRPWLGCLIILGKSVHHHHHTPYHHTL
jgi:hypothetical protein